MSQITFKGKPIHTSGHLPQLHQRVPDFSLVDSDLNNCSLSKFAGKKKCIGTVPSLDTGVCSVMTKRLEEAAKQHPDVAFLVVSADLPFAQKRFCKAEKVDNVHTLSMMRNKEFGRAWGVLIQDGPLAGLLARSLLVLNERDELIYAELVPEITQEPDYANGLAAI